MSPPATSTSSSKCFLTSVVTLNVFTSFFISIFCKLGTSAAAIPSTAINPSKFPLTLVLKVVSEPDCALTLLLNAFNVDELKKPAVT